MNKSTEIFGIDISKDVFDVYSLEKGHHHFANNETGFKQFIKKLSKDSLVVMEATGYYHYCLAQYLYEKGYVVSVVNPLSVKRFIQMKLSKVKTDKSDAKSICEYALNNEVPLYTAKDKSQAECLQLLRLMDTYVKPRTAMKNKLDGEQVLGIPSKAVYRSLSRTVKHLNKELALLEARLIALVKEEQQEQLRLLKTIPGIGEKAAILLVVFTDGFSKFENSKQLCCYAGITPTIRQSGSSVRGRSRISKIGNKKLRNQLFLSSFTACQYNKACRELFERIVAQGKSKKLALLAVCNKLLKQAFAIAKSGMPYNENFVSKMA
jgi:transposase